MYVENGTTGKYHLKLGMSVVYLLEFTRPSLIFMDFIDDKMPPVLLHPFVGKPDERMVIEIGIVGRHVEPLLPVGLKEDMLLHHCGLSNAARTDKTDHTVFPQDAVVHIAAKDGRSPSKLLIHVCDKVEVCHGLANMIIDANLMKNLDTTPYFRRNVTL